MRVVATLIGLIFAATVVVAQDAVEPTPHPVYPLCEMAFKRVSDALPAEPSAGLVEAASPQAEPAPSMSPDPLADLATLDEAVRMCSSVGEFTEASALYPEVLGGVDPMDFLAARCRNDATDLGRYATCASLELALATPTPEPTQTATPSPSPSPTAQTVTETPAKSQPKAKRKPKIKRTAKPTPRPRPRATPKPTPRPTPKSDWTRKAYKTAQAHQKSMRRTYITDMPDYLDWLMRYDSVGATGGERAAMKAETQIWVRQAKSSLNRHVRFMRNNPAATCFRDAYRKDRKAAKRLLNIVSNWRVLGGAEKRYRDHRTWLVYDGIMKNYVRRYGSFFNDCQ